jgi:hypothetical protein
MKATIICEHCGRIYYRVEPELVKIIACDCGQHIPTRLKGENKETPMTFDHGPAGPASPQVKTEKKTEPATRKSGATGLAFSFYQEHAGDIKKGSLTRAQAIERVIELGVNKGTASVQWSKFIRSNK